MCLFDRRGNQEAPNQYGCGSIVAHKKRRLITSESAAACVDESVSDDHGRRKLEEVDQVGVARQKMPPEVIVECDWRRGGSNQSPAAECNRGLKGLVRSVTAGTAAVA